MKIWMHLLSVLFSFNLHQEFHKKHLKESEFQVKELRLYSQVSAHNVPTSTLLTIFNNLQQVQQVFNFIFILVLFPWPGIGR